MLFIVIHQVYELWFKQVLHETDLLRRAFEENDRPLALATLKRILTIFKTLVSQVDILETMTPVSFPSFRDRLDSASGFQSFQFREFEVALGHRVPGVAERMPEGSAERRRVEERLARAERLRLVPAVPRRSTAMRFRRRCWSATPPSRRSRTSGCGRSWSGSTATTPRTARSASASSTSTRGSRSGATAT